MNWTLFTLTKQESNPHVGKQLLYIAPNFNLGSMAASAIYRLNMTSQDTYAYVTMDYSRLTFTDYEKSDNSEISSYNKNISLISKLKTDISNGTGPDILLDFAKYSSLNSSDYLYDLMGVINDKSKFNREDYFDNIFDAYAKNGKLYQMPVSACVGGIYALDTAVSDSKTGFTYTEYEDYVLSECGGFDPLEYNKFDQLSDGNFEDSKERQIVHILIQYAKNSTSWRHGGDNAWRQVKGGKNGSINKFVSDFLTIENSINDVLNAWTDDGKISNEFKELFRTVYKDGLDGEIDKTIRGKTDEEIDAIIKNLKARIDGSKT